MTDPLEQSVREALRMEWRFDETKGQWQDRQVAAILAAVRSQPAQVDQSLWRQCADGGHAPMPDVCHCGWSAVRSQPLADDFRLICTHCPGDPEVGRSDCTARESGDGGVVFSCPQCGADLAALSREGS